MASNKKLTADSLYAVLHRADLEHDSNTGENNNDRIDFLEQALDLLEKNGLLRQYTAGLLETFGELDEYAGLYRLMGRRAP